MNMKNIIAGFGPRVETNQGLAVGTIITVIIVIMARVKGSRRYDAGRFVGYGDEEPRWK